VIGLVIGSLINVILVLCLGLGLPERQAGVAQQGNNDRMTQYQAGLHVDKKKVPGHRFSAIALRALGK